ncbi:MAG: hypothetical protein ACRCST_13555 [Turicibacter sp.]
MEFFTGGLIKLKFNEVFNRLVADMIGRTYKSLTGNTQLSFSDDAKTRQIVKDLKNTIDQYDPYSVSQETIDRLIANYLTIQEQQKLESSNNLPALYHPQFLDTVLNDIFEPDQIDTKVTFDDINQEDLFDFNSRDPNYGLLKDGLIKIGRDPKYVTETTTFSKLLRGDYDDFSNENFLKSLFGEKLYGRVLKKKGSQPLSVFLKSPEGENARALLRGKDIFSTAYTQKLMFEEINKMPSYAKLGSLLLKEIKNGKLMRSNQSFKINLRDMEKVSNEFKPIAGILRSMLPKDQSKTLIKKLLADLGSGDREKIDGVFSTVVNAMLTDKYSFFSKTHLSYAGVVEFLTNSADRIQSVILNPKSTLYGDNTRVMHYVNPESKPRKVDPSKYELLKLRGNLNVVSPILYSFLVQVLHMPKSEINVGSMISTLSSYLDLTDRMMKSELDKVVTTFSSLVDVLIRNWHTKLRVGSLDEAKTSVDIILGQLVSKEIDDLDIPADFKPTFRELQKIIKNQDLLMANILSKTSHGYIEDYTNQGLVRDGIIRVYNELNKGRDLEATLFQMCVYIYPYLDIDAMSINHYKKKISDASKEKQAEMLAVIDEYEKTGIFPSNVPRFEMNDLKRSLQAILADNGKSAGGRRSSVQKFGERVFFYKSFDAKRQVFINLGIFESNYNILLETLMRQIRARHKYKYLTLTHKRAEYSILDEINKLHDVVKATLDLPKADYEKHMKIGVNRKSKKKLKLGADPHKFFLSKAYASLKFKTDYLRGSTFVPPSKPPNKIMEILGNLFFGSALSGMPLTSIVNDAITTSFMLSTSVKEVVNFAMTYAKTLTENLNDEELKIAGSVLPFDTIDHSQSTPGEKNFRRFGTKLYSNEIISHDGRRAAGLVINKVLARDFINGSMKNWERLDKLIGFKDKELYDYIAKNKDKFIVEQENGIYLLLTYLMNDEMRYRYEGRAALFVDLLIPEQDTIGAALKYAADRLPYISLIIKSLLMFKSPTITEFNNTMRVFEKLLKFDPLFVTKYAGVSIIQSVIYNYLKIKGRGGDVEDFKKFMRSAIIQSPLTGVLGDPISKILDKDIGGFLDTSIRHPAAPLLVGGAAAISDLVHGHTNAATYDIFKAMNSYNLIRNFPVLGAIWRRYFLENLYDFIYPENRAHQNLNRFAQNMGVNYD